MDDRQSSSDESDSPYHEYDGDLRKTRSSPPPQTNTEHVQPPSLRAVSDTSSAMTASSTPLGQVNAARRPGPPTPTARPGGLPFPEDIQAKMKAFSLSRQAPPGQNPRTPPQVPRDSPAGIGERNSPVPQAAARGPLVGGIPQNMLANAPGIGAKKPTRPQPAKFPSANPMPTQGPPIPPAMGGLAAKRGLDRGMKLSDVGASESKEGPAPAPHAETQFSRYSEFVDTKTGSLNFRNKATIHGGGIDFTSGRSFKISLDEVETLDELGKGNYGTVYKVRHCRPHLRRPGLGLRGTIATRSSSIPSAMPPPSETKGEVSNVVMAMKEIRLELDEAKFTAIIMELDILHRCVSPFIIDFYGAFFQEGAVYICVEYMDGGSVDRLYKDGIPEPVLRKIALSTIMGLKSLKDDHNIIHRDVKPTNILVNTRGQVKICDFGVSGNLVASIAKTNIGCQSYMAPERIAGGGGSLAGSGASGATYSVQSDVWSLGLTVVECAIGRYPYPPETYNNIFSQLNAIVQGEPPYLPEEGYSKEAKDFVSSCLNKSASARPSYAMMLRHPWLRSLLNPPSEQEKSKSEEKRLGRRGSVGAAAAIEDPEGGEGIDTCDEEVAEWVKDALDRRERGVMGSKQRPALHAVALDAVPGSPLLDD